MARRFHPKGEVSHVVGRNGARDVLLTVRVPYGEPHANGRRRTRTVEVPLDPEFILDLAEALRCCPQQVGERVPVATNEDGTIRYEWREFVNVGHAVWHLHNPEAARPCLPWGCKIIDVADEMKLPSGPSIDVLEPR